MSLFRPAGGAFFLPDPNQFGAARSMLGGLFQSGSFTARITSHRAKRRAAAQPPASARRLNDPALYWTGFFLLEIDVNQKLRSSAAHDISDALGADEPQQTICSARSDYSRVRAPRRRTDSRMDSAADLDGGPTVRRLERLHRTSTSPRSYGPGDAKPTRQAECNPGEYA